MAAKTALLESFLSCHVCSETFRDPVSLSCNHSFCSSCLQKFWAHIKNKNCPICKRRSSKEEPWVNFALKELADSFAEGQKAGSPETERGERTERRKHQEETTLFSEYADRVVVPVCVIPLHHSHEGEEEVTDPNEQLKSLHDKRDKYKQVKKTYEEMVKYSMKQLLSTERQIRSEFKKLHQFLKEEEKSRLEALWEEEEQKGRTISREMKRIQEHISSLSQSIAAVEEDLQKHTQTRVQRSLPDPQLLSGALIDVAKHLGNLSFRVWDKMKDKVHFSPVILDPNTACPDLCLSDDLTSVRNGDTNQQLPDNPERNISYANVLGSEGFSSGTHSWEVEVGDHPHWNVGLVKESAVRQGTANTSPDDGIWCLTHLNGIYIDVVDETVRVEKRLQRIGVQLDYDRGEVSFYDPVDMSNICTHRDTFTEKLFPWFSIGPAGDAQTADIKICHTVQGGW